MRVKDLKALLNQWPDDAEICYEDGNFGGASSDLETTDIKLSGDTVLIRSPYWQDVTEGERD